jgi:hypothetical protein
MLGVYLILKGATEVEVSSRKKEELFKQLNSN